MLHIGASSSSDPKGYFSSGQLPQKIETKQLAVKKPPFSTINSHAFNHTVHILSPIRNASNIQEIEQRLHSVVKNTVYAKVHLKPAELLRGDFFNKYIKAGNILLRSEGRQGVDNLLSLHDGILRIELDKLTYERAGLQGKPVPSPGRKHVKQRFLIEVNLRLPSMVRGRPLFNRLVYAFENVLTDTLTFLFYDIRDPALADAVSDPTIPTGSLVAGPVTDSNIKTTVTADGSEAAPAAAVAAADSNPVEKSPIAAHAPFLRPLIVKRRDYPAIKTPRMPVLISQQDASEATELLEWLHLAIEGCPRLAESDGMDPFLNRYAIPDFSHLIDPRPTGMDVDDENDTEQGGRAPSVLDAQSQLGPGASSVTSTTPGNPVTPGTTVEDLSVFEIRAFVPSSLVAKVFVSMLGTANQYEWFAMRVQAFDTSTSYTILVKDRRYMIWQCD